jgi:hypothetical protein
MLLLVPFVIIVIIIIIIIVTITLKPPVFIVVYIITGVTLWFTTLKVINRLIAVTRNWQTLFFPIAAARTTSLFD